MPIYSQNNVLPSGEKSVLGRSMVIQDVSRHHTGVYTCTADNGVGQPASADIDLKVLCESMPTDSSVLEVFGGKPTHILDGGSVQICSFIQDQIIR